jgi:alpha-galactosidase
MGSNVYVFPGPARARLCRTPLDYDKWLPSTLFLTHYLPDDPRSSQMINLASLILGQNGIWGDLLNVSDAGVALFGEILRRYKQVRADITVADPVRRGIIGGSPEVHEKINPVTGRGAVAIFAAVAGRYSYVTDRAVAAPYWAGDGVAVTIEPDGRARLDVDLAEPGAALVFFGVDTDEGEGS